MADCIWNILNDMHSSCYLMNWIYDFKNLCDLLSYICSLGCDYRILVIKISLFEIVIDIVFKINRSTIFYDF